MSNACEPQVMAIRMRVAKLGVDGVPEPGATNLYVTDALISIAVSPVYLEGTDIVVPNAGGVTCVEFVGPPTLRRADIVITLCTPDPYLMEFLSYGSLLTNGSDIGYAAPSIGVQATSTISVEAWANRIDGQDLDGNRPYAWWVYPRIKNLRLQPHTHNAGALQPAFAGQAIENDNWWNGPTNDWPAASDKIYQWLPTNHVPDAHCGPIVLAAS